MREIVLFKPAAHRRAEDSLAEFISLARDRLSVFGADLDWAATRWELKGIANVSGRKKTLNVHWAHPVEGTRGEYTPLLSGNGDVFRAVLRYAYGLSPKMNAQIDLAAFRCLDLALARGPRRIVDLRPDDLGVAVETARVRYSDQMAYRVGVALGNLVTFLREHGLLARPFTWKNPIPRPRGHDRIGPDRERNDARAMPKDGVLDALADAYDRATEPMDVLALSVIALLLTTHARIAEIHRIDAYDCEVEQERKGKLYYGLRWSPAKGAEPETRWIPSDFVDLARDALRRMREVTESGRALARRYEAGEAILQPGRDHPVTRHELEAWGLNGTSIDKLMKRAGLNARESSLDMVDRSRLEAVFREDLPDDFPIADEKTGLPYSRSLTTICKAIQPRSPNARWRLSSAQSDLLVQTLCGHDKRKGVLERLDCRDADGNIARITPHQLRHLLTTLANEGGLSQLDTSRWAGRRDPSHNQYYDHETMGSLVERARELGGEMFGDALVATPNGPVTVADFIKGTPAAIHLTEFGVCRHDFSATPCPMHRDCLACVEHACVKGDARAERSLRERLLVLEKAAADAREADDDGAFGAGVWRRRSEAELARLRALVAILDDPAVPNGAVLSLGDEAVGKPKVEAVVPTEALTDDEAALARAMAIA